MGQKFNKDALALYAKGVYARKMYTVVESPNFAQTWDDYWTLEEFDEFVDYVSENPTAGVSIPGSGGCRKVRWSRTATGKRGGVRVIYIVHASKGALVLLLIYAKSAADNVPAHILRKIAEEWGDGSL